jgi:hypothetical protein
VLVTRELSRQCVGPGNSPLLSLRRAWSSIRLRVFAQR